jgi:hypothetical protein
MAPRLRFVALLVLGAASFMGIVSWSYVLKTTLSVRMAGSESRSRKV